MFLDAAVELQKRDYELEYSRKDRHLTIRGLYIAAIALVVNLIFSIASFIVSIISINASKP